MLVADTHPSLVDSFARAGFLTVAPDLFNGTPAPSDLNNPNFNSTQFVAEHGPEVVEPLLETAINYLRSTAGASSVGIAGYCFGGRYSFRMVDAFREVRADMAFAAHPSRLQNDETAAVGSPVSVACAGMSIQLTPSRGPLFSVSPKRRPTDDIRDHCPPYLKRKGHKCLDIHEVPITMNKTINGSE